MSDLNKLYIEDKALLKFFLASHWENDFSKTTLSRAQKYTTPPRLISVKVVNCGPEYIQVRGKFKGNHGKNYTTEVSLEYYDFDSSWELFADCSCPVSVFCKHGAALLTLITQHLKSSSHSPSTLANKKAKQWLNQLKTTQEKNQPSAGQTNAKKKQPSNTQFLAYCLKASKSEKRSPLKLKFHLGRHLKSADVIDTYSSPHPTPAKPTRYMEANDSYPCYLYQQEPQYRFYSNSSIHLSGTLGAELLQATLKTGRLFLVTDRHDTHHPTTPVTLGDPIEPQLDWHSHMDGSVSPVVKLPNNAILLPTEPPYAFSFESAQLYPIKTDKHSQETIQEWKNGPTIPATSIPEILPELEQVKLPKPNALTLKKLKPSTPTPRLKLYRKNPFTHAGLHFSGEPEPIIGELSFLYHNHKFTPNLEEKPPVTASFSVIHNDSILEIPRDTQREIELILTLVEEWTIVPSFVLDSTHVAPNHVSSFLPKTDPSFWDSTWANFIAIGIPILEKLGWQFEIDPSAHIEVMDIGSDQLETGLSETPDHGIDWFQFQASYLTPSGEKRSLLPILSAVLKDLDLDELDSMIQDIDDSHKEVVRDPETEDLITLPTRKILMLAKNIGELFGQESPETPIHKIQAAGIADSLDMDSSKTLRALAELGNSLKNITTLPKPKVPKSVKATLRDYQLDGFHWLQFLARHALHGILADDMGLGKTLQTLTHIQAEVSSRRNEKRPSLVIAPTSVVGNWQAEAAKFCPRLKVLFLHGSERKEKFDQIDTHHLVLTTYGLLVRDFDILSKHEFHIMALDEAQYIKNPASKASQCACQINAQHRISLSGTPIENHLGELWSQMRFLMPGLLGNQQDFRTVFRTPIEKHHSSEAQAALNRRVAPLILRRTKNEVATELPEKTHILHTIPLNKQQIDIYETVRAAMDKRVREAISTKGMSKSHIIVLDALLKLRQICCHPQLLKLPAAQKVKHSAKLDFLTRDLLPTLFEEGRKILLFSTFTSMLKIIEDHLKKEKIPYAKITGQTRKRQAQIDHFQDGDAKIFLISLKAGGTGLNLTAADTVIHYDPWWNPAAENQATDRAHRIGQTKPVFVHKLIMEGSIEQRIQELQAQKSALVDALLTTDTNKLKIDKDTLNNLLAPIG